MKKPEEYLEDVNVEKQFVYDGAGGAICFCKESDAIMAIDQAQKEAWNSALDWATEHALLKIESKEIPSSHIAQFNGYIDDDNEVCITASKESILKGKI